MVVSSFLHILLGRGWCLLPWLRLNHQTHPVVGPVGSSRRNTACLCQG